MRDGNVRMALTRETLIEAGDLLAVFAATVTLIVGSTLYAARRAASTKARFPATTWEDEE